MIEILRTFAYEVFRGTGTAIIFVVPFMTVAWWLSRRRTRFRAEALDPFTELPLRPPGESLRLKIESLTDEFDNHVAAAAMIGFGSAMFLTALPADKKPLFGTTLFLVCIAAYVVLARQLGRLQRQLWDYRVGYMGERVVGEELNQLMRVGFAVFHDVPFDGFNIDHVLVGPKGVFAVETKSPRKRASIKGLERAKVYSDGEALRFPTWKDVRFIPQARLNAKTLAEWLASATGEPVPVRAILTLPGWSVERLKGSDVNVLRPDEIKRSFPSKAILSPEQIQRITHQLTERCRLAATK